MDNKLQIIIANRQTGKTSLLIDEAYKNRGIIVAPTLNMARCIEKQANEKHKPIMVTSFGKVRYLHLTQPVYYDEFGVHILHKIREYLQMLLSINTMIATVDRSSIDSINNLLKDLNITNMAGEKINLKIVEEEVKLMTTDEDLKWVISDNLYSIMEKKKVTQAELCRLTGLSSPTITRYYHAEQLPTLANAKKICEALGISLDRLVEEKK